MHETPTGERIRISFFGRRNAGKSTLVNALTGQNLSLVSDIPGTTTDPVSKAMELLPLGPVLITDTAGLDDEGILGAMRVEKSKEILQKTDIAVLVFAESWTAWEEDFLKIAEREKIPCLIVQNKADLNQPIRQNCIQVSAIKGEGIAELKKQLGYFSPKAEKYILKDLVSKGDFCILVTPIDASAPKGRMILPQQQVLREILDIGGVCLFAQPSEYEAVLKKMPTPKLVITDSQVFSKISALTPREIPLTSFSILMARYKGFLMPSLEGVSALQNLKEGDKILIAEGCTHHRQCNDIGSVQIPKKLQAYTGKNLNFVFRSGGDFSDLDSIALAIHCGGCMLSEKEMQSRMKRLQERNIPVINYGIFLAQCSGILERCIEMLPV